MPYDDILRYPKAWPDISELRDENAGKDRAAEGDSKTNYYMGGAVASRGAYVGRERVIAGFEESGEKTRNGGGPGGAAANDSVALLKDAVGNVTAGKSFGDSPMAVVGGDYFKPQQLESEKQKAGEEPKAGHGILELGSTVAPVDAPGAAASVAPGAADAGKSDVPALAMAVPSAPGTPPPAPTTPTVGPAVEPVVSPTTRKIIRNGQMEFEVERFDGAFAQVSKLTTEAGELLWARRIPEKLPNGR